MPILVFSAMVLLLQDARDLIEEIGNQRLGVHEPVGAALIGFVAVPMIEGHLPSDKPTSAMKNPVGVVIAHQPPTISGVEGQRLRDSMRLLWRRGNPPDLESRYASVVVNDLFPIEVEQVSKGFAAIRHSPSISVSDMAQQMQPGLITEAAPFTRINLEITY